MLSICPLCELHGIIYYSYIPYSTTNKLPPPPPSAPNKKKWLMFKCPYVHNRECFCVTFFIIMYRYHFVSEMLNTFETFEVKEMRTFKHEPFFIVGGGGGGAYSW